MIQVILDAPDWVLYIQASAKVQKWTFPGRQIAHFFAIVSMLSTEFNRLRASGTQNALRIMLSGLFSHDRPRAPAGRSHRAITAMGVVKE